MPVHTSYMPPSQRPASSLRPPSYPNLAPDAPPSRPPIDHSDRIEAMVEVYDRRQEGVLLGVRVVALVVAWVGSVLMVNAPVLDTSAMVEGMSILGVAFLIWLGSEVYASRDTLMGWWAARTQGTTDDGDEEEPSLAELMGKAKNVDNLWTGFHPLRVLLFVGGTVFALFTFLFTTNNAFTPIGFASWLICISAFAFALSPDSILLGTGQFSFPRIRWNWPALLAFVLLVALAATFRFYDLRTLPPQMTSDHVEKLRDSFLVSEGTTRVFFPNNGGREPFQMYAMAAFSWIPGVEINFFWLKVLSALEGIITLPFLWWMGREVVGERDRRLGNVVGLLLVGFVAASHWHTALSRLALRIVLTPLVAALLITFLSRALRDNRRVDYIRAGLVLGFGLYAYQAVRMLPVVVTVGVVLAFIFRVRSWLALRAYVMNYIVLAFIAFVVFIPMFVFSIQQPDQFWLRTSGRLLGDGVIHEEDEEGRITLRNATFGERMEAFAANLPVLRSNIGNVLLMFNWKGDVAWINNSPNAPQMDAIAGSLFILGLAAWLARMVRTRDPADWLMPAALFLMLLPSALAIAYPVENPSATRTSGALPIAYLFVAYPVALMGRSVMRLLPRRRFLIAVPVAIAGLLILGSFAQGSVTYFVGFREQYLLSSLPHRQGGADLRAFNNEMGTDGNAFMIGHPFWWDHRALGLEANYPDWPHGIVSVDDVPGFLRDAANRTDRYRFDPNRDILFFHATEDDDTALQLRLWFPDGQTRFVPIDEQRRSYTLYRVPALGASNFEDFAAANVEE